MRAESKKLLFDIAQACRAIQEFNPIQEKLPLLLREADALLAEPEWPQSEERIATIRKATALGETEGLGI